MKLSCYMFTLLLMLFCLKTEAQVDTCSIDTASENRYHFDAINLAIGSMQAPSHPYYDSIHIPDYQVNRIMKGLGRIYDLTIPERDTVVTLYDIHWVHFPFWQGTANSIYMYVDTSYLWVKQFVQDSVISGNASFDSLIADNGFRLAGFSPFFGTINVHTDSVYNLSPIIKKLSNLGGVFAATGNMIAGDGDGISYQEFPSCQEFIFSHGWEDCPSGCIYMRFWVFHVFPNCSAAFITSYGDKILLTGITDPGISSDINIYPNPVSDKITIEGHGHEIELFDLLGKQLWGSNGPVYRQVLDISSFSPGVYLLKVSSRQSVSYQRIVKH